MKRVERDDDEPVVDVPDELHTPPALHGLRNLTEEISNRQQAIMDLVGSQIRPVHAQDC